MHIFHLWTILWSGQNSTGYDCYSLVVVVAAAAVAAASTTAFLAGVLVPTTSQFSYFISVPIHR